MMSEGAFGKNVENIRNSFEYDFDEENESKMADFLNFDV